MVRASSGQGVPLVDLDFRSPATGDPPALVEDDKTDSLGYFQTLVDSALWDVSWIADVGQRLAPLRLLSVDLRADQDVGVLSLSDAFLLQGTVTDLGFFPVADADLDVRPAGEGAKLWTPQDNSDEAGEFALILPPGTYDITATPPLGFELAPVTARSVALSSDLALPNLALPPAVELRGRCKDPFGQDVAGVDVDVDSLPNRARLEIPGDQSDANGEFRVLVPAWDFRVTLSPAVADRLLPVRFDSLHITGPRDLGEISFPSGHWVSGTVAAAGAGTPIAGANLDLRRLSSGALAITPGDVTDGTGFFRITTDQDLYRLTVIPPTGDYDTLVIEPFRTLGDTTVALELELRTVDVAPVVGSGGEIDLYVPRPNPGRGRVTIQFTALGPEVELSLWDVAGRRVALLYRGEGGRDRRLVWSGLSGDGRRVPAGVYSLRLVSAAGTRTRRLVWLP